MKGNAAIVKCSIPSFVADFVSVVAWVDEDNEEYVTKAGYSDGKDNQALKTPPIPSFPSLAAFSNLFYFL